MLVPKYNFFIAPRTIFDERVFGKPFTNLIVSTGATYDDEIQKAAQILKSKSFTFLHCITIYPTPLKDINLNRIKFLKKFTKNVGYSDHTIGNETAIAATALGAKVIEKHITLNKSMRGPDHRASMEPKNFYNYVKLIRNTEKLLGSYLKKPSPSEIKNKKLVRKSDLVF